MAGEPEDVKTLVVADGAGRLDAWLTSALADYSRAKIQRLIEDGQVKVNGLAAKARTALKAGDVVTVGAPPPPAELTLAPAPLPLAILYEDPDLIVIDKPAGLTVHPGAGTTEPTLVAGLLHHVGESLERLMVEARDPLAMVRPGIVHRLDKDTTGVLVCAKTDVAHAQLAQQFHDKRSLVREYTALLSGVLKEPYIDHTSYLGRDPASRVRFASLPKTTKGVKRAQSLFRVQDVFAGRLTLARVRLLTGRTHQIRVHARDLGAPVWGDQVYGRAEALPTSLPAAVRARLGAVKRQLLHARVLELTHPRTGERLRFEAPLPPDFMEVLELLAPFSARQVLPIEEEADKEAKRLSKRPLMGDNE